ncbi:pyridoxamine 5'-phosphate oxidase [Ornithinimicrobium sp. Y1847]|uniref:pyridoxamine 5'-phosphate oxidase n=1 Tax=Ornithinimicrobium sp. Y1847 TaxID=3405419 RepID=UPI003B66C324
MSIPVEMAALDEALSRHDTAYLLTSGDGRPHVAEVFPQLVDGHLILAEPGRTARRVVGDRSEVTVMLPPREYGGYTLIIDGTGEVDADDALRIAPTHAVWHRAAGHGPQTDSPTGCGNDCQPLSD